MKLHKDVATLKKIRREIDDILESADDPAKIAHIFWNENYKTQTELLAALEVLTTESRHECIVEIGKHKLVYTFHIEYYAACFDEISLSIVLDQISVRGPAGIVKNILQELSCCYEQFSIEEFPSRIRKAFLKELNIAMIKKTKLKELKALEARIRRMAKEQYIGDADILAKELWHRR